MTTFDLLKNDAKEIKRTSINTSDMNNVGKKKATSLFENKTGKKRRKTE